MKITCMRGFPGSGKTTLARKIANETGAVVICRDDIRFMLHASYWTGRADAEVQVSLAERASVRALLHGGQSVIVDATHLNVSWLRKWSKLAAELGASFECIDVPTSMEHCIIRDRLRGIDGGRSVGEEVIVEMARKWPIKHWPVVAEQEPFDVVPVEWVPGLPTAIIVDIDGTVAHHEGIRSPYDYSKVLLDNPDEHVPWLIRTLYELSNDYAHDSSGYVAPSEYREVYVLFVSGRDDTCRVETLQWLAKHNIPYDALFMRPTGAKDGNGNKRPDYKVKYELFDENIRGKYNVRVVLDDRNQVVDLWRRMGLKCLQVAEGDF